MTDFRYTGSKVGFKEKAVRLILVFLITCYSFPTPHTTVLSQLPTRDTRQGFMHSIFFYVNII